MTKELDLAQVFKAVSKTLVENQSSLDEADTVNHDHGTNMVNTFKLIEKAVKAKKRWYNHRTTGICQPNAARKSTSGSAMLYADGLENAAKEFEGKTFDREGVGTLLNALMGTPQNQAQEQTPSAPQGNDFLSTLVGGMASSQQTSQGEQEPTFAQVPDLIDALGGLTFTQEPVAQEAEQNQESDQTSAIDLVGSLLGGLGQTQPAKQEEEPKPSGLGGLLGNLLGGGKQQSPASSGVGGLGNLLGSLLGGQQSQPSQQAGQAASTATSLLSAALAYLAATQQGKTPFESILEAVGTATRFSDRQDRTQSGALVAQTLIGLLSK